MRIGIDQPNRNRFCIIFQYDADLVAAVKQLPGARYDGNRRIWTVPAVHAQAVLDFGAQHNARIDAAVHALIESQTKAVAAASATTDAPADAVALLELPASIVGAG